MKMFALAIILALAASAAGCGVVRDFAPCVVHSQDCN
jgi:hypothetical protein